MDVTARRAHPTRAFGALRTMADSVPSSNKTDRLRDHIGQHAAVPEPAASTARECHEAIAQILFSLNLTLHTAQRAAVDEPERVPELLKLMGQQLDTMLELSRRLSRAQERPMVPGRPET